MQSCFEQSQALFDSSANYHTRRVGFQGEFGPTTDEAFICTLKAKLIGLLEQVSTHI